MHARVYVVELNCDMRRSVQVVKKRPEVSLDVNDHKRRQASAIKRNLFGLSNRSKTESKYLGDTDVPRVTAVNATQNE